MEIRRKSLALELAVSWTERGNQKVTYVCQGVFEKTKDGH